jgi:catechol 2,3-dioxygenase-like lactoylglutathione lyase family enzyme
MLSGRFDHLVLTVHRIKAACDFCENVLGMKPVERNESYARLPITE